MGMVSDVNFAEMAKTAPVQEQTQVITADLKDDVMLGAADENAEKVK